MMRTVYDIMDYLAAFLDVESFASLTGTWKRFRARIPFLITQHVYTTELSKNDSIREWVTARKHIITASEFHSVADYELKYTKLLELLGSYLGSRVYVGPRRCLNLRHLETCRELLRMDLLSVLKNEQFKQNNYELTLRKIDLTGVVVTATVASILFDVFLEPWWFVNSRSSSRYTDSISKKCIRKISYNVAADIVKHCVICGRITKLQADVALNNADKIQKKRE
jgi:hypothetical protein